jgi:hypothetical protein
MRYIKPGAVRKLANSKDKRVSKSFMLWLDGKVERIIERECRALGQVKKTLNLEDSSKLEGFDKH